VARTPAATVAAARCRSSALRRALKRFHLGDEGWDRSAADANRFGKPPKRPLDLDELGVDRLVVVIGIIPSEARERLGDGVLGHGRMQNVSLQGIEDERVRGVHGKLDVVLADGAAPKVVGGAAVEEATSPPMAPAPHVQAAAAPAAHGESGQQVLGVGMRWWSAPERPARSADIGVPHAC
jgi:hypothetical protein